MKKPDGTSNIKSPIRHLTIIFTVLSLVLTSSSIFQIVNASNPASDNINPMDGEVKNWQGSITIPGSAPQGEPTCIEGTNCDTYTLKVNGEPSDWSGFNIRIRFNWTLPATDYDMAVRKEDNNVPGLQGEGAGNAPPYDSSVATSGNGTNTFEEVVISPSITGTGDYYIRAVYFAGGGAADNYNGSATVFSVSETLPPGTCAAPTFDNFQPPVNHPKRDDSGEPSVGVNWKTDNVIAMSRLVGQRATFDTTTSPSSPWDGVDWFSNTTPILKTGLDPILFTDKETGRTLGGELSGNFTNGFISDDDLTTLTPDLIAGSSVASIDHQTIGGGPPNPNALARQPRTGYPHLFYYAAQNIGYADVATSFDGGVTFDKAVPAYTLAQCNGLHGHIKVAPDGTVYLPNKNCGGKAAVVVSEDNGLTWTVRSIPTSGAGDNDPSVGIGANGRIYVGYTAANKHPRVAVSDDKGKTWHDDYDLALGVTPNLRAAVFPAVVAGDNNRAAVFFLATDSTNPGDPTGTDGEDATAGDTTDDFKGTWFPYMATTCDGGKSWSVVRADNDPLHPLTPNPVQQGVICTNGTTCPGGEHDTRNLLDFNDIAVDSKGRIIAVYADGCNFDHPCINISDNNATRLENQSIARLTIIRQRGGLPLFSAFDRPAPTAPPLPPPAIVKFEARTNTLQWATPDDGGSPLLGYRIYSGSGATRPRIVARLSPTVHKYTERIRRVRGAEYYYVTAYNAYGESPRTIKLFP